MFIVFIVMRMGSKMLSVNLIGRLSDMIGRVIGVLILLNFFLDRLSNRIVVSMKRIEIVLNIFY